MTGTDRSSLRCSRRRRPKLVIERLEQRVVLNAAPLPTGNYFEVQFTNQTDANDGGQPSTNLYVSVTSQTEPYKLTQYQSGGNAVYLAEVDTAARGTVQSLPLSDLVNGVDDTLGFYVLVSNGTTIQAFKGGRIYVADQRDAVALTVDGAPAGVSPTSGFDYDFIEFTVDPATSQLNLDTTQVDQFGMPINLQVTPVQPDFPNGTGIVTTADRATIVGQFATYTGSSTPYAAYAGVVQSSPTRLLAPQHVIDGDVGRTLPLQQSFDESLFNFFNDYYAGTGGGGKTLYLVGNGANGPEIFAGTTIKDFSASDISNASQQYTVLQFQGTGYQYLEANADLFPAVQSVVGASTGGNASTTLNDTTVSWTTNQFQGSKVTILAGTGKGQTLDVGSNTPTQLVVTSGWTTIPDHTSTFAIWKKSDFYGGATYQVFYPYWTGTGGNAANLHDNGLDSAASPPPQWYASQFPALPAPNIGLPVTSAGRMVLGCSGSFADDVQQKAYYETNGGLPKNFDHTMLGNLENQLVTMLNRGVTAATGDASVPVNMFLRTGSFTANDLIAVDLAQAKQGQTAALASTSTNTAGMVYTPAELLAAVNAAPTDEILWSSLTGTIFFNGTQIQTFSVDPTDITKPFIVSAPTGSSANSVIHGPPSTSSLVAGAGGVITSILLNWQSAADLPASGTVEFSFTYGPPSADGAPHYATLRFSDPYLSQPIVTAPQPAPAWGGFAAGSLGPTSVFTASLRPASSPSLPTSGMAMSAIGLSNPTYVYAIPPGGNAITVYSPQPLKPINTNVTSFADFYPLDQQGQPVGAFNAYAAFFHIGDVANSVPPPTVDGKGYAFAYDDNGGYSSDISVPLSATAQTPVTVLDVTLLPWGSAATAGRPAIDLNGDGIGDTIWRKTDTTGATVGYVGWIYDAGGNVVSKRGLSKGGEWALETAAYFTTGPVTDFVWRNTSTNATVMWVMKADGSTAKQKYIGGEDSPEWQVETSGDYDGNGSTDLIWRNSNNDAHSMWLMNEWRVTSDGLIGGSSTFRLVATAADYDANDDGCIDLIWRNTTSDGYVVHLMQGTKQIGAFPIADGTGWDLVATGNYDINGIGDLLWREQATGAVVQWLMTYDATSGTGKSRKETQISTGATRVPVQSVSYWGNAITFRRSTDSTVAVWKMLGSSVETKIPSIGGSSTFDLVRRHPRPTS